MTKRLYLFFYSDVCRQFINQSKRTETRKEEKRHITLPNATVECCYPTEANKEGIS